MEIYQIHNLYVETGSTGTIAHRTCTSVKGGSLQMTWTVLLVYKLVSKKFPKNKIIIIIIKQYFWGCSGPQGSHTHQYFPSRYVYNHAWGRLFVNRLGDVLI